MIQFHITPLPIEFRSAELEALKSHQKEILADAKNIAFSHWDRTLREWFHLHLGGIPPDDDLRQHGRWLIPRPSSNHICMQQDFAWRGQVILSGYLCLTTGQHHIHPVTPVTSSPHHFSPHHSTTLPLTT